MSIKISDLQKKTKKINITFQEETLNVEYKINVVTPAFVEEKLKLYQQLARAISSWDLMNEDGSMVEISEETFKTLPVQLQTTLLSAITDDMKVAGEDQKKD
jgi:hypothetical protein